MKVFINWCKKILYKFLIFWGFLITLLISFFAALGTQYFGENFESFNWGEIIETTMTFIGSISIPVIFAIWAYIQKKQDKEHQERKEKQLERKEEKDFLLNYIREELIPLRVTHDKLLINKEEIEKHLKTLSAKLLDFNSIIKHLSYNYMCDYLDFLLKFMIAIIGNEKLSAEDLREVFLGFSVSITFMLSSVLMKQMTLMKQDDYKKAVPTGIIMSFISCSENVKNIMYMLLKEKYPNDYDTLVKDMEDKKNKIVKTETINE